MGLRAERHHGNPGSVLPAGPAARHAIRRQLATLNAPLKTLTLSSAAVHWSCAYVSQVSENLAWRDSSRTVLESCSPDMASVEV